VPQDVAIFDELLPTETLVQLLDHVISKQSEFVPSRVLNARDRGEGMVDTSVRQNLHLKGAGTVPVDVLDAIKRAAPALLADLEVDPICLETAHFESEITATGDGGFFRAHVDNGHERLKDRLVTFVYFFSEFPRPFSGGELCVERDWRSGNRIFFMDGSLGDPGYPPELVTVIDPRTNRLAMFRGDRIHEVRQVTADSTRFGASRFTVTGWVRSGGCVATGNTLGQSTQDESS
jgi:SM-20-related protein